jgi:hypothetical protein
MGSDRAGLVSAIWLHDYQGVPLNEARRQMSFFPYMHVSAGAAGSLVRFLDMYEEHRKANPDEHLLIRDWVRLHYFTEREGREIEPWYDGVLYTP